MMMLNYATKKVFFHPQADHIHSFFFPKHHSDGPRLKGEVFLRARLSPHCPFITSEYIRE